jgi:Na+-translocating ferredoxin:NAD+ oxidoreductase RnfE subunit
MLQDFTTPEYIHALSTSISYGLGVVVVMLGVGSVLTLLGGGLSARWWGSAQTPDAHPHHH